MRSDVPEGWEIFKAGEVFDLEYGKPLPAAERTGKGFPVYGSNGVVGYHDSAVVRGPGIIVGRKGSAGSIHWASLDFSPIDTTYYVRPKGQTDLTWLYFSLLAFDLPSLTEATGIPGLNRNVVGQQNLWLPPLAEQRKIAAILTSVDEAIQATEAVIAQTRRVKDGLLQELLTRGIGHTSFKQTEIGEIPETWEVKRLGDCVEFINGRAYKQSEMYREGPWQIIRIQNLKGGDSWYYSDLVLPERQYCNYGDLLFAWSATFGPFWWHGEKAIFHYHIWRLECTRRLLKSFCFTLLEHMKARVKADSHGGLGMLHMTKSGMEGRPIAVPPVDEQQMIEARVESLRALVQVESDKLSALQSTKAGLLQDLLTGKVRVGSGEVYE